MNTLCSKLCRIQQTFMKGFYCMLFLLLSQFHGVPEESIVGLFLLNIFSCDFFLFVMQPNWHFLLTKNELQISRKNHAKNKNFIMENYRRFMVRVRVRFSLFYSDLAPLTRDVTCSRFYLDGKSMRKKCQIDNLSYLILKQRATNSKNYERCF